jgi:20S proteasome subunit beta 3
VGLDEKNEPYVATTDLIGCLSDDDNFACVGTGENNLLGACESFYKTGLESDALFEIAA